MPRGCPQTDAKRLRCSLLAASLLRLACRPRPWHNCEQTGGETGGVTGYFFASAFIRNGQCCTKWNP